MGRHQRKEGGGFSASLSQAVRTTTTTTTTPSSSAADDDVVDWSVHTLDYAAFKELLVEFSKRRNEIQQRLSQEPDGRLEESVLQQQLLGLVSENTTENNPMDYVPMQDHDDDNDDNEDCNRNKKSEIELGTVKDEQNVKRDDPPFVLETFQDDDGYSSSSSAPSRRQRFSMNFRQGPRRLKRRKIWQLVSTTERNQLLRFLESQSVVVSMFYMSQWQKLSHQFENFCQAQRQQPSHQLGTPTSMTLNSILELAYLGDEILELQAYCVIQSLTLRQILMRYDAFCRVCQGGGVPVMAYYLKEVSREKDSSFHKILQHNEVQALVDQFLQLSKESSNFSSIHDRVQRASQAFDAVLESSSEQRSGNSNATTTTASSLFQTLRYYFTLGTGYEQSDLLLTTLTSQSLISEMKQMAEWRQRKEQSFSTSFQHYQEKDASTSTAPSFTKQELHGLAISLTSAFLYCMNYYIVEPSSTLYVNALGAPDSLSGTLIGLLPLASFCSCIFWSYWTNHCFRLPYLTSGALLWAGNILYAAAFNYKSLKMAFFGRFLAGLGGPKCIVRRYLCDTTSLQQRTTVNMLFGMVVATGSAVAPGLAVLLSKVNFSIPLGGENELFFNGMTGPGYFMAFLWTLFGMALIVLFREPEHRVGLEEQKQLEAELDGPKEGDTHHQENVPGPIFEGIPSSTSSRCALSSSKSGDDTATIFSGKTTSTSTYSIYSEFFLQEAHQISSHASTWAQLQHSLQLLSFPVRLCLGLLFCKVWVIETLVSSTSALTKNRYQWQIREVGLLGFCCGVSVIPISILIGRLSVSTQDRTLMTILLMCGIVGMTLLIDISDMMNVDSTHYNEGHLLAVGPKRYGAGYFVTYISIQSFEGVIGSALSKVIPTQLASGTFNSGLLATLVDTSGRSLGDLYISVAGMMEFAGSMRQLMNLLFVPGAIVVVACLVAVRRNYDVLAV